MRQKLLLAALLSSPSVSAATLNGFDASLYGFIKTSVMYANEGLGSYNNINLSAPTHAVAQTRAEDKTSRMSFQTQQSRAGVVLKKNEDLSARLEVDFIDFNKSSPTVQSNPRVRIASITYVWDNHRVIVGQDWDLYSPVTSFTFDYVGLYFLAGNTGFIRQQAQYLHTQGDWELGAALGMAGNNPGTADADLELSKSPTYALRLTRNLSKGRVGLSAIYAHIDFAKTTGLSTDSYAGNFFYEQTLDRLTVKTELYYAQNLANIGSLGIGRGTSAEGEINNVREFGATLTGMYQILDEHFLFGGFGFSKVDNKTKVLPFQLDSENKAVLATHPGILNNTVVRLGWEYRATPDLSWISEVSRFQTTSKLKAREQLNLATSIETGLQLRF